MEFHQTSMILRYAVLGRLSAVLVKRVANVTKADALTAMAPLKCDAYDNSHI